ncbi:MAG: DUF4416 family protein [Anaerolineae bacterium]
MMGKSKTPAPVKLVVGMFTAQVELFETVEEWLGHEFGPIDYRTELLPFDHTTYYAAEFGENLVRKFVTFAQLIDAGRLAEIKRFTNDLEMRLAAEGKRRINLDPGYISLAKLVLASTKDHQHRLYLGQEIYGEVTLRFVKGSFRPWDWTYPDYGTEEYIAIFNHIRQLYLAQLREAEGKVTHSLASM